jgi:3-carboxy-cis,cis-muconate cycloisomerase
MTDMLAPSHLLTPLYASAAMRAIMTDQARLQRMLDFEAALARAEAAVGVITAIGAAEIVDACRAEYYDVNAIAEAAAATGSVAAAVIHALTLVVAKRNRASADVVHWGASNQDLIDTALVLEMRAAIDAVLADLDIAIKGFSTLAGRHRRTLTVARTMLQHALPMPLGLKLAGYAAALARSRDRLWRLRGEALALQFGGAAGTLAALGEHGFGVTERLAALLDLQFPDAPWHSHRDRLAEVAAAFAILSGTCGKIARDVALLMQVEVAEAFEPETPGREGVSTLPHKRNPEGAAAALSAATIAPNLAATILAAQVQEHERAVGGWQTDWITFPALALVTSGALSAVVDIANGLEIDAERMRANLELSGGRIMAEAVSFALAEKFGKAAADKLVRELCQRASKERRPLKDLLLADLGVKSQFSTAEIEKMFIPLTYQGSAQVFIDRLVVSSQMRGVRRAQSRPVESRLPTEPPAAADFKIAARSATVAPPPAAAPAADLEPVPAAPTEPVDISEMPMATAPTYSPIAMEPPLTPPPEPASAASAEPPLPAHAAAPQAAVNAATERAAEESAPKTPPQPPDDTPGALMDVLSRAQAEAAALAESKRKRS